MSQPTAADLCSDANSVEEARTKRSVVGGANETDPFADLAASKGALTAFDDVTGVIVLRRYQNVSTLSRHREYEIDEATGRCW